MTEGRSLPAELFNHLAELSRRLGPLAEPLQAWLAGGFAVHHYTQHRLSWDLDIKWSHRIPMPTDLQIFEISDPGSPDGFRIVTADGGFSDVLGSFPPYWETRAPVAQKIGNIVLHIIDPTDPAVSKVTRFSDRDRGDIQALARLGLIDPETFAQRAEDALDLYVGDLTFVRHNLADAREIIATAAHHAAEAGKAREQAPGAAEEAENGKVFSDPLRPQLD